MEGEDWDFVQLTDHNDQRRNRFELQLFNELMPKVRDDRATLFLLFSVRAADLALLFLNPVHEFQFSLPPRNHRLPKNLRRLGSRRGRVVAHRRRCFFSTLPSPAQRSSLRPSPPTVSTQRKSSPVSPASRPSVSGGVFVFRTGNEDASRGSLESCISRRSRTTKTNPQSRLRLRFRTWRSFRWMERGSRGRGSGRDATRNTG